MFLLYAVECLLTMPDYFDSLDWFRGIRLLCLFFCFHLLFTSVHRHNYLKFFIFDFLFLFLNFVHAT